MKKLLIAKKILTFMTCSVLSAGLITVYPSISEKTGNNVSAKTIAEIQEERNANEAKIAEYEKQISQLEGDKANEKAYQETLAQQIRLIQENITLLNTELDKLNDDIQSTEENIVSLDAEITQKQQSIDENVELFKSRLCSMYVSGGENLASIVLGSSSFYDMMSRVEMVNRIASYDEDLINQILEEIDSLDKSKKDLESEKLNLEMKLKDQEVKKNEKSAEILQLNEKMQYTQEIINSIQLQQERLNQSKEETQRAIDALDEEEVKIQAEIKRQAELAQKRYEEEQRRILEEAEAKRKAAEELSARKKAEEEASKAAAEQASREAYEQASRAEVERISREAYEQESRANAEKASRAEVERISREAYEQESRANAEKASREAYEQESRANAEKASRAEVERISREAYEQESRANAEKASREAYEQESRANAEKASREAYEEELRKAEEEQITSDNYEELAKEDATENNQIQTTASYETTSATTTTTTATEVKIPDPSPSGFIWPTPGFYYISSGFGARWGTTHKGIDIGDAGIMGGAVCASKSGTVTYVNNTCTHNYGKSSSCGCGGGYGNYVIIQHDGTYSTLYGHMTNAVVSVGDYVQQGDVIGYVGSTGWSTGAHLHFEVRVNGIPNDPMGYVNP